MKIARVIDYETTDLPEVEAAMTDWSELMDAPFQNPGPTLTDAEKTQLLAGIFEKLTMGAPITYEARAIQVLIELHKLGFEIIRK